MMTDEMPVVLTREVWEQRSCLHAQRVQPWIAPYLDQKSRQAKHPVYDFLFQYYSFRPGQLARWSPGPNVTIEAARIEDLPSSRKWWKRGADGWRLLPFPNARREHLEWAVRFLEATSTREPNFFCFGMHEWAMVHRESSIRHLDVPLRLERSEIARPLNLEIWSARILMPFVFSLSRRKSATTLCYVGKRRLNLINLAASM